MRLINSADKKEHEMLENGLVLWRIKFQSDGVDSSETPSSWIVQNGNHHLQRGDDQIILLSKSKFPRSFCLWHLIRF